MYDGNETLGFEKISSITFQKERICIWGERVIPRKWYRKARTEWSKVTILCPDQDFTKGFKDKRGNIIKLKEPKNAI